VREREREREREGEGEGERVRERERETGGREGGREGESACVIRLQNNQISAYNGGTNLAKQPYCVLCVVCFTSICCDIVYDDVT